jgi:hypothetical protein
MAHAARRGDASLAESKTNDDPPIMSSTSLRLCACFLAQGFGFLTRDATAGAAVPGVQFGAPSLRFADGEAVTLQRDPMGSTLVFRGPAGTPAAGVVASAQLHPNGENLDYAIEFTSATALKNIQLVQEVRLEVDWRSYVIAPGAMYQGNRFVVSPQPYAPYLLTEGVGPAGPIVVADIPRLTSDRAYRAELAANALSIPAVGVYDSGRRRGYLVGVEVYGEWGVTGVNLATLPGENVAVEVCLPVRRKQRYRFCDWVETKERGVDLQPGVALRTRLRLRPITAENIPAFVSRIAEYGYASRGREARRPNLSFAEAARLIEGKLNAFNWNEATGYYRTGLNDRFPLQTGWVGGGVTFFAMASSDHPLSRERGKRMMDVICREALTPSGYFHGMHDGKTWRSFGVKRPGCRAFSLIRRPLECTRDVLKTIELLRRRGEAIDPVWERAARANLEAIVRTADKFGHLGYTVDFDTGDVLWGDTACGSFALETLVRGAAWFGEPRYLETAKRLAEYYVTHFVHRGFTCGGVGDALMAADTESNYALLAGLMKLHAATGDARYLAWARETADLLATWVLCYDAKFPPESPLGKLGIQPRGAVFANTQNQHGAPGICTTSGAALLALYEATGEERYLRTLEDIITCVPQMIVRPGQEWIWQRMPPGCISERLMTMDGLNPCGQTQAMSTWAEIAMLLTVREIPAVYRDDRRGRSATFDLGNRSIP